MGPDEDMPAETQCACINDAHDCPGDDGRDDNICSGCGHLKPERIEANRLALDSIVETANRRVHGGTIGSSALTAAGGWTEPLPRYRWPEVGYTNPTEAPRSTRPTVEERRQAVEQAQRSLRTNRGIGVTEPGLVEEIMRLADYILTGQQTSVDVAVRD